VSNAEEPDDQSVAGAHLRHRRIFVVALVATSGSVVERYTYTAYGTATALNPDFTAYSGIDSGWTRLFAGMNVDMATGLYYDNARWYNSNLATFESADPAGADVNTYRYADGNPITQTDPSGQQLPTIWEWDPAQNTMVDRRTRRTKAEVEAAAEAHMEAERQKAEAWRAKHLGNGKKLVTPSAWDGFRMVTNDLTLHQWASLNDQVNELVDEQGGLYATANWFSHAGVASLYAAGALWVSGAEFANTPLNEYIEWGDWGGAAEDSVIDSGEIEEFQVPPPPIDGPWPPPFGPI
jgi:RHS repeat-associated protein